MQGPWLAGQEYPTHKQSKEKHCSVRVVPSVGKQSKVKHFSVRVGSAVVVVVVAGVVVVAW